MNIPEIAKCPNPECGKPVEVKTYAYTKHWGVLCRLCGYEGPLATSEPEAIRLHNAICRQPTPEAADKLGRWLSAALEDPAVCQEMKADIEAWFAIAHPPKPEPTEAIMTDAQIKHMVDRFLGWRLPENFTPDAGISFKPTFNDHMPQPMKHEPTGTNLFDATQADAMVRYLVEGLPVAAPKPPAEWMADLKKLAKDIDDWGDTHLDGPELEVAIKCHAMVLALIKKHYSAPAEGWQPIETGPKDGSKVQLFWDGKVTFGFYLDNSKSEYPWEGWRQFSGEVMLPGKPTLWQPLAAAPKEGKP